MDNEEGADAGPNSVPRASRLPCLVPCRDANGHAKAKAGGAPAVRVKRSFEDRDIAKCNFAARGEAIDNGQWTIDNEEGTEGNAPGFPFSRE